MESIQEGSPSHPATKTKETTATKTHDTAATGTNKSLTPYNPLFQQALLESCIYPPYHECLDGTPAPQPENLNYIRRKLARRRPSLSSSEFSEKEYMAFIRKDADSTNETEVGREVIPVIQGILKSGKTAKSDILFANLTPFTTHKKVASGKPDSFHGAISQQLELSIREKLDQLIIPSTQKNIILPNHFTAIKGPDGRTSVARRQANYDGYLGARGIHALQNYGQAEPIFDNKAYTFAFIYQSPVLSVFVCHPVQPTDPGKSPSYYLTPVRYFAMLDNVETWREGAKWYRNAIDLAKKWRDDFIRLANNVVRAPTAAVTPNVSTSFASTGNHLGALAMGSQVDDAASGSNESFETAENPQEEEEQDEEDEKENVVPQQSNKRRDSNLQSRRFFPRCTCLRGLLDCCTDLASFWRAPPCMTHGTI